MLFLGCEVSEPALDKSLARPSREMRPLRKSDDPSEQFDLGIGMLDIPQRPFGTDMYAGYRSIVTSERGRNGWIFHLDRPDP